MTLESTLSGTKNLLRSSLAGSTLVDLCLAAHITGGSIHPLGMGKVYGE